MLTEKQVAELDGLRAAHRIVHDAFNRQLEWWTFIPILGIGRILTRNKLLRVGQYIVDRKVAIERGGYANHQN